jgi:hypothetical protein
MTTVTITQILFASEKISRGSQEPSRRDPFVLYSSVQMKKASSRKLLAANQLIVDMSRNKVAANKSWFTVYIDLVWNWMVLVGFFVGKKYTNWYIQVLWSFIYVTRIKIKSKQS